MEKNHMSGAGSLLFSQAILAFKFNGIVLSVDYPVAWKHMLDSPMMVCNKRVMFMINLDCNLEMW